MARKQLVLLTLFAIVAFAAATLAEDEAKFQTFMKKYNKLYATNSEYDSRFEKFRANLRRIERLNKEQTTATYGIDQYSDMSIEEFRQQKLLKPFNANEVCQWPYHRTVKKVDGVAAPPAWDWRTATNPKVVTPVKDQAQCGSCWSFSTTGNIEGVWALKSKTLVSLSEQEIVDCSTSCLKSEPSLCNSGCGGGLPWLAYEDIISWKSITTEAAYPYTGQDGTCNKPSTFGAKISNWTSVDSKVATIEAYLVKSGPLSICLNADLLFSYTSGIITGAASSCPGYQSDHAVLLVGYGTDAATKVHYWIVKNSWNTSWGDQGYFKIQAYDDDGSGMGSLCGITACVTAAIA